MEAKLKILISVFVALIIGFVLISTVADQTSTLDDTTYVANETFTAINDTAVELVNDFITTIHEVRLVNGTVVATTGYNTNDLGVGARGKITMSGTITAQTAPTYTMYANYTYANSALALSSGNTSRTLVNLNVLLFALGLLAVAIVVGMWALKEMT